MCWLGQKQKLLKPNMSKTLQVSFPWFSLKTTISETLFSEVYKPPQATNRLAQRWPKWSRMNSTYPSRADGLRTVQQIHTKQVHDYEHLHLSVGKVQPRAKYVAWFLMSTCTKYGQRNIKKCQKVVNMKEQTQSMSCFGKHIFEKLHGPYQSWKNHLFNTF